MLIINPNTTWTHKNFPTIKSINNTLYRASDNISEYSLIEGNVQTLRYDKLVKFKGDICGLIVNFISLLDFNITDVGFLDVVRKDFEIRTMSIIGNNGIVVLMFYVVHKKNRKHLHKCLTLSEGFNITAEDLIERILDLFKDQNNV